MDNTTFNMFYATAAEYGKPGQMAWTTPGTYTFVVPNNVYTISAVCIGGGATGGIGQSSGSVGNGGSGADLRYASQVNVTPGESLTLIVGDAGITQTGTVLAQDGSQSSIFRGANTLLSAKGGGATTSGTSTSLSGTVGGGNGGIGGSGVSSISGAGAGAGGYSGGGGNGESGNGSQSATSGVGGGGGGGRRSFSTGQNSGGGGGCGILGEGASGAAGTGSAGGGLGGSGGTNGANGTTSSSAGGVFGAGGSGSSSQASFGGRGGSGAVRIIWGFGRAYPSTRTADE